MRVFSCEFECNFTVAVTNRSGVVIKWNGCFNASLYPVKVLVELPGTGAALLRFLFCNSKYSMQPESKWMLCVLWNCWTLAAVFCVLYMYSVALFPHSFLCPCLLLRSVSLSSLYSLLKARLCPYFYLCSYQVGVNMQSELCSATPSFSSSVSLSVHSVVPGSRSWRIQQHHCFHFPHNEGPQRGNEGWRWELNCSFGLKINFHLIHLQP